MGRRLLFSLVPAALAVVGAEVLAQQVERARGRTALSYEALSPVQFQALPLGDEVPWGTRPFGVSGVAVVSESWADLDGQGWPDERGDDELRIVFVGGSALGGWGVPPPALHTGIVQRLLDDALPDRRVSVLNLGMTGWSSTQLRWTVDQVLPRLQPDLVVTLMGNNERMDIANALRLADGDVDSVLAARDRHRRFALQRLRVRPGDVDRGAAPQGMPQLNDLPALDRWDGWVQARTERSIGFLRRRTRQMGAELLVSSVPVNHRYHRLGHEWWFLGEERFGAEAYRTAQWALRYGAPQAAVEAMRAGLLDHPDDGGAHLILAEATERLGGDPRPPARAALQSLDNEVARVWATRLADGTEAATALAREAHQRARAAEGVAFVECSTADLFWYAGARAEAAPIFERCLLPRMLYRADSATNETLRRAAGAKGAGFLDLDAVARGHSDAGVPDFDLFYDYCHYSPRGNVLAGHALAAGIAQHLGLELELPSVAAGLAAHDAGRAGRLVDRYELAEFAGVEFDVTNLVALRPDPQRDSRRGPPDDPQQGLFAANRNAASANWSYWDAFPIAVDSYLRAMEGGNPAVAAAASENLRWLLDQPPGRHWRAGAEEPWPSRIDAAMAPTR